jgi:hypothetical protein
VDAMNLYNQVMQLSNEAPYLIKPITELQRDQVVKANLAVPRVGKGSALKSSFLKLR